MQPAASFTIYLTRLPIEFLYWWFVEASVNLIKILWYILRYFYHQLSINLIFKTFFKPWKNEYREGLVGFSLFMGMFMKSLFLVADLLFFTILISLEAAVLAFWIIFPAFLIWGVYVAVFPK